MFEPRKLRSSFRVLSRGSTALHLTLRLKLEATFHIAHRCRIYSGSHCRLRQVTIRPRQLSVWTQATQEFFDMAFKYTNRCVSQAHWIYTRSSFSADYTMCISRFPFFYGLYLAYRILLKLKGRVIHMVRNLTSAVQRVTLVGLFGSLE